MLNAKMVWETTIQLTLQMLRLHGRKMQRKLKPSNPCHVGIH